MGQPHFERAERLAATIRAQNQPTAKRMMRSSARKLSRLMIAFLLLFGLNIMYRGDRKKLKKLSKHFE